ICVSSAVVVKALLVGMIGQPLGSRVLVAIPPVDAVGAEGNAQAGVGATDTVVCLITLLSEVTPLPAATGTAVPPKAGLPTATVDGAKPAQIIVPKTAARTSLVVQAL